MANLIYLAMCFTVFVFAALGVACIAAHYVTRAGRYYASLAVGGSTRIRERRKATFPFLSSPRWRSPAPAAPAGVPKPHRPPGPPRER